MPYQGGGGYRGGNQGGGNWNSNNKRTTFDDDDYYGGGNESGYNQDGGNYDQGGDYNGQGGNGGGERRDGKKMRHEVAYSQMTPEQKAAVRKQERQAKKDHERTMGYFNSVGQILNDIDEQLYQQNAVAVDSNDTQQDDANQPTGTAGQAQEMLNNVVAGFITELNKRIQLDETLLHNKAICRTIESVISRATSLKHVEAFLKLFAPKLVSLMMQPTSSYVAETIFASVYHVLDVAAANNVGVVAADEEGAENSGDAALSADAQAITKIEELLSMIVDDVCESMNDLASNTCGAHCTKALSLMLTGIPIRDVPQATSRKKYFPKLALRIAETFVATVRKWGVGMAGWMSCCTNATSVVVLSGLMQCACKSKNIYHTVVVNGVDSIPSLIPSLMTDPVGSHVVQAYLRVSPPKGFIDEDDEEERQNVPWRKGARHFIDRLDELVQHAIAQSNTIDEGEDKRHKSRRRQMEDAQSETAGLDQALLCLQDAALYTSSEEQLQYFYDECIKPHLTEFVSTPSLVWVLVKFSRKVAFEPSKKTDELDAASESSSRTDGDAFDNVKQDEAQGVTYFSTSPKLRAAVCTDLVATLKTKVSKGAAQALLVDRIIADVGFELGCNMMRCGRGACSSFLHSFDKINSDDLMRLAKSALGGRVIQQFIEVTAADAAPKSAFNLKSLTGGASAEQQQPAKKEEKGKPGKKDAKKGADGKSAPAAAEGGDKKEANKPHQQQTQRTIFHRFYRRFEPKLFSLAVDRFAGFIVQAFYEYGPVDVKESIVKNLSNHYDDINADFFGKKVLVKCCVEQYVYRPDEWRKLAERNSNIKLMMQQVLAAERQ